MTTESTENFKNYFWKLKKITWFSADIWVEFPEYKHKVQ